MTVPVSIVANLASVMFLLRDPGAREPQLTAFRLLRRALGERDVDIAVGPSGLLVDGVPVGPGAPGATEVREQLLQHGVGRVTLPAAASESALLALLRALVAVRGTWRSLGALVDELTAATGITFALRPPAPEEDETPALLAEAGGFRLGAGQPGRVQTSELPRAAPSGNPREVDRLVAELEADCAGEEAPAILQRIVHEADVAAQRQEWVTVEHAALGVMRCEQRVEPDALGRAYPIALRRLLPRAVLEQLARRLVSAPDREERLALLKRMGADATDVLLTLLAEAPTMEERRTYYDALRQMTEGAELFTRMLARDEWYVIRNVAELCGELGLEAAVPALAAHAQHPDERVRRAVAGALARIGSAGTVEPIRQLLRDPAPTVRLQAAQGLDGWRSRGFAMTIAVLLDDEGEPAVQREMLLALGRIGTPEAIQALARAAAPGKRFFGRKSSATRLGAVEALGLARGPAASAALQELLRDDDAEVRVAAQRALAATV